MRALKLAGFLIPLALASGVEAKGWGPKSAIMRPDGTAIGTVRVRVTAGGLAMQLQAKGLPSGENGMHIHAVGRCDGPAFASAGPHWNPADKQHGRLNPAGQHLGDLGNLLVSADGSVGMDMRPDPARSVPSPFDADGASLVIHAMRDDERTDPSGNSGARIACAVLAPGK